MFFSVEGRALSAELEEEVADGMKDEDMMA